MMNAVPKSHRALRRRIDTWCDETGHTYSDLARSANIDNAHLCNMLAGRRRFSPRSAMSLSLVTGIPVDEFLEPSDRNLVRAFLADAREKKVG